MQHHVAQSVGPLVRVANSSGVDTEERSHGQRTVEGGWPNLGFYQNPLTWVHLIHSEFRLSFHPFNTFNLQLQGLNAWDWEPNHTDNNNLWTVWKYTDLASTLQGDSICCEMLHGLDGKWVWDSSHRKHGDLFCCNARITKNNSLCVAVIQGRTERLPNLICFFSSIS